MQLVRNFLQTIQDFLGLTDGQMSVAQLLALVVTAIVTVTVAFLAWLSKMLAYWSRTHLKMVKFQKEIHTLLPDGKTVMVGLEDLDMLPIEQIIAGDQMVKLVHAKLRNKSSVPPFVVLDNAEDQTEMMKDVTGQAGMRLERGSGEHYASFALEDGDHVERWLPRIVILTKQQVEDYASGKYVFVPEPENEHQRTRMQVTSPMIAKLVVNGGRKKKTLVGEHIVVQWVRK